jgi:hypothetical protein
MSRFFILLALACCFCSGPICAQADTLNKLNTRGKKTGYWKVLLNENADPVDSLKDACFYGIELWDGGEYVFSYFKHPKYAKLIFEGALPEKGDPQLIEGTFKWYDSRGYLANEEVFKNGRPFFYKSYNWDKENPAISTFNEVLYFDRLLDGTPGTYYYEELGYGGRLAGKYWYKKGKRGWRVYRIKE